MSPARSSRPSRPATSRAVCATRRLIAHADVADAEHDDGLTCERCCCRSRRRSATAGTGPGRRTRTGECQRSPLPPRSPDATFRPRFGGKPSAFAQLIIRGTVRPPRQRRADMATSTAKTAKADRLLLSPQEPLVAGGPAEELERRIQEVFKSGQEHVVIDLRGVPTIDSAGIRALVRGHTTAQRLNRRFTLVAPNPRVRETLELSLLDARARGGRHARRSQDAHDPVGSLRHRRRRRAGRASLVGVGMMWPDLGLTGAAPASPITGGAAASPQAAARWRIRSSSWPSSSPPPSSACSSPSCIGSTAPNGSRIRRWIRRRCCCASPAR